MAKVIEKIMVVQYEEKYAQAVADMWNDSQEEWGGGNTVMTKEQILRQERTSGNLNLYLALEGEKVVGYCGLSEYREDEGSLYIPLLNVRPDYHGKKIGKMLLLEALNRTVELGWPRLDLYTWPGNTKAVPLYKKCGFFWEERDDSTHLMNFIPTVLSTEAVKEFFDQTDWYDASKRVIEVKPDGTKDNGFTYYQYLWEKDEKQLRMEFERSGRGLRLIETEDYVISTTVENFDIVFGSDYQVHYHVMNKTDQPLVIELQGESHHNIDFSFNHKEMVKEEAVISGTFYVGETEEDQSNWRTHPSVVTQIKINGKKATFKTGILPKAPAKVQCQLPQDQCFLGETGVFYLDLENNSNEQTMFTFTLPSTDWLCVKQEETKVALEGKERISVPIHYTLQEFGFYEKEIEIVAEKQNGLQQVFRKKIGLGFRGLGAQFPGECEEYWHIFNGLYHVKLSKFDNRLVPARSTKKNQPTMIMFPKLGKPYSQEFSKKRPTTVDYQIVGNTIIMKANYESKDFPNLNLCAVVKLLPEGIIEHYYEVVNVGLERLTEVCVSQSLGHNLKYTVFGYDNEIIEIDDSSGHYYNYWKGEKVTSNWLFSKHEPYAHGIAWSKNVQVNFASWYFFFEHDLGSLKHRESKRTDSLFISIGTYQTWQEFERFATKGCSYDDLSPKRQVEFKPTADNPVNDEVEVLDRKANFFNGLFEVTQGDKTVVKKEYETIEQMNKDVLSVATHSSKPIEVVEGKGRFDSVHINKSTVLLHPTGQTECITEDMHGHEVWTVRNGSVEFSTAPDFAPSMYSLKVNGKEWLDHSFPKVQPKAWWNPWCGGVMSFIPRMSINTLLKEKSSAQFTTLLDQHQNEWNGLKVSTIIKENESFKGLCIHQYYVTLPGLPVVAMTTEIEQHTGTYFNYIPWDMDCFLKPSDTLTDSWLETLNYNQKPIRYSAGYAELDVKIEDNTIFGNKEDLILQIAGDGVTQQAYMNKKVLLYSASRDLHMAHGERKMLAPLFFLFHDQRIPTDALQSLKRIRFRNEE